MDTLTILLGIAWLLTLGLLIRSLFRQAGIADAMKETSDQASSQMKLWEEFGQHLDEGVALVNEQDVIAYANTAFTNMVQWQHRSAFNQELGTVLQLQDGDAKPAPLPDGDGDKLLYVLGKDGGRTPVHAAKRGLKRPAGYSVVVLRDATAETAEQEIRSRLVKLSSFELRAPITAMKGYASMILEGDTGKIPKETEQYVRTILESTDTLLTIVDDMAHVDALSADKRRAKKTLLTMQEFIEQARSDLDKVAQAAGRPLEYGATDLLVKVEIDPKLVGRLLSMLVNTAARTAKQNTTVTLSAEESTGTVEIHVVNHGDPLPKESQANVFDYAGGHGLDEGIGFYVAKQIIQDHHAFVTVNTQEDGNIFVLSLPKAAEPKPAEPAPDPEMAEVAKSLQSDVKPKQ